MTLVTCYDLKLHQKNAKVVFLNEKLKENICMDQLVGFIEEINKWT